MGLQDLFGWREKTISRTPASMPAVADEDLAADVDEPPDHSQEKHHEDFHKSSIHAQDIRKQSLLTQALQTPATKPEVTTPQIKVPTQVSRRRSMISNTSVASTAELTSDGGLTSPARTNTPSPPFPSTTYTSFAPYSLEHDSNKTAPVTSANVDVKELVLPHAADVLSISPKAPAPVVPRKRITFACGGRRDPVTRPAPDVTVPQATTEVPEAPKRQCRIKFACSGPKPAEKSTKIDVSRIPELPKPEVNKRGGRSPSATRKSPRAGTARLSLFRRSSQSPVAVRARPKYISADEATLSSEATRFHEFASGELEEDDWIRRELDYPEKKLTINDTLKMENAIRQLGNEAEAEALEEGEEEDEQDGNSSGEETIEDDDNDDDDLDGSDIDSDIDASDGNETDNEEGFADSDDESDDGDFAFWTPGRTMPLNRRSVEALTYRASANDRTRPTLSERILSASSIDSLVAATPPQDEPKGTRRRHIKIRPGTPDLPDSTDFVCGTLDEDRPLEDAYASCMAARKNAKHKQCPQDIDPSFPTSDIEDEEDEEEELVAHQDSDEEIWIHGKFEDLDEERSGRRRSSTVHRKSPGQSPKRVRSPPPQKRLYSPPPTKTRLRSPPPAKTRLRSPPPRKLFGGHSPRRMRSPPPARTIRSPPASPTLQSSSVAIAFAPLGSRPGLTHTKSLPRTPNAFCRAYRASRLVAANGDYNDDTTDGHVRGAIDIVKGLERKRQRRKEKYLLKHPRKKGQQPKKPQPGKGAERMREIGLLMAGKTCVTDNPYMLSA